MNGVVVATAAARECGGDAVQWQGHQAQGHPTGNTAGPIAAERTHHGFGAAHTPPAPGAGTRVSMVTPL